MSAVKWQLSDLPELRPGDGFISRGDSRISRLIRWWFSGWEGHGVSASYFKCFGNHMGWIDQQILDDEGQDLGVTILQSGPRGQNPGELWECYQGQDIIIVRPKATAEASRVALMRAAACGYRAYDWLLPWALIRKYGLLQMARLILKRLNGRRVLTPHVRDGRDVCVEYYQEPWEDCGFNLYYPQLLLVPDPSGSANWDVIFDSRTLRKEQLPW